MYSAEGVLEKSFPLASPFAPFQSQGNHSQPKLFIPVGWTTRFKNNIPSPIFTGKNKQLSLSPYKFQLFLEVCYFAVLSTTLQHCLRVSKHSGDARGYCLSELRCFKQWVIPESAKCNASFHLAATYPLGGKLSITLTNLNTKKKTTEIWSEIHLINHQRVLSLTFSLIYVTLSTSPPPTAFVWFFSRVFFAPIMQGWLEMRQLMCKAHSPKAHRLQAARGLGGIPQMLYGNGIFSYTCHKFQ